MVKIQTKVIQLGAIVLSGVLSMETGPWRFVGYIGLFQALACQVIKKLNLLAIQPIQNAYNPINTLKTPAENLKNCFKTPQARRYEFSAHQVPTPDGTILMAHRVNLSPEDKKSLEDQSCVGKVALLVHSMNCCSEIFFAQRNGKDIGNYWVEKGYDVWLTNQRGNRYSLDHKNPKIGAEKFFDFTLEQYGQDIETYYKFVEKETKFDKITWVSYSLGGLIFSMSHSDPRICDYLNSKTERAILIAPLLIPFYSRDGSGIAVPLESLTQFKKRAEELGIYGFGRMVESSDFSHLRLQWEMEEKYPSWDASKSDLFQGNSEIDNTSSVIMGDQPVQIMPWLKFLGWKPKVLGGDGVSIKIWVHAMQMLSQTNPANDEVKEYDYCSEEENLKAYGTKSPPVYNYNKIGVKVDILIGSRDICCNGEAAKKYKSWVEANKSLNGHQVEIHMMENYKHISFALPKDLTTLSNTFDAILAKDPVLK